MRATFVASALALVSACTPSSRFLVHPAPPPANWCSARDAFSHAGVGAYSFLWFPTTSPPLTTYPCEAQRKPPVPKGATAPVPPPSTLAELVVPPGAVIELPVRLPPELVGAGCVLDSVVIAHGKEPSELAIDLRAGDHVVPLVAYAQIPRASQPPPPPPGPVAPPAPPVGKPGTTAADERFQIVRDQDRPPVPATPNGGANGAGAPTQIELGVAIGSWRAGVKLLLGTIGSDGAASISVGPPAPPEFYAIRHRLRVAAPDEFSIAVRAGTTPFGIAVRSNRESADPTLLYRASASAEAVSTQLVPQAAILLSHCRRRADRLFDSFYDP